MQKAQPLGDFHAMRPAQGISNRCFHRKLAETIMNPPGSFIGTLHADEMTEDYQRTKVPDINPVKGI